jgi:flagellar motor switch protein FliM
MSRILSREEIDALVVAAPDGAPARQATPVVAYNFRRPDRFSKEQIRSLHLLHERFARNAATSLTAFLRSTTEITIVSVEQFTYSEFLMSLPDPTVFYGVAQPPFETLGALELNPAIAFAMLARMLGGGDDAVAPPRALTEIEQNVVDSAVKLLLDHLTETWRTVTEVQFQIQGRETRPQMLQVASWNEVMILLTFDVNIGDTRGLLNICVPASTIEAAGTSFVHGWQQSRREPTPTEQRWLTETLGRVRLPVTTDIEARLRTRELLTLEPGQVLSLGIPAGSDVNVRVGDIVKFHGRLAAGDGRAAIRITRSGTEPREERIEVQP